jgi:hypothetical protein
METTTPDFILAWDRYLAMAAYVCVAFSVIILLYHEFRVFQIKDNKEKYDYVNLHEITYFWYAVMGVILGVAFYVNALTSFMNFATPTTWFYVRMFMMASFIVVAYFIFFSLVRIYYPRYLEKKLTKLRNKPRISPDGNIMRKLKASEEEAHLEADQLAEQKEIHSVDYDVWLDEKTGYKKIEKYISYHHSEECPECGYVTLKIDNEELIEAPKATTSGILVKHLKCTYCGHREAREVIVAALQENMA